MNQKQLRGSILLLLCAFIWGSTFVAQSAGAESFPPFAFLAARSFVGSGALLCISLLMPKKEKNTAPNNRRKLLWGGIICGSALAVASALQQYGITLGTGASKAGFLTALYLVFVPILNFLLYKKKPGIFALSGALLALLGLFFLCGITTSEPFSPSDLATAACGLCFAIHIITIDRYATDINCIHLSCLQFFVCGVLSLCMAFFFESPSLGGFQNAFGSILYAGLLSSALAYTLQIYGQKHCPPTVATVLMSLESVFALGSEAVMAFLTNKAFSFRATELFGCLLMFVGVLLAQKPIRSHEK